MRSSSCRIILICALLLAVCTLLEATPSRSSEAAQARWAREVLRRGVDPATVPYPLAWTQEMETYARAIAGTDSALDQLKWIQDHLFDEERFPFNYDSSETYTAREAFDQRIGNCVSFTNLFIALARSQGHLVGAALPTFRGESERVGELIIFNTHIVAVYERNAGMEVFDFGRLRERQQVGFLLIDDFWVTAIYLNNLGAEALLRDETEIALGHLEKAVKLAPGFAPTYGNLGVVRRKLGDITGAIEAYLLALEIEPGNANVLNNLAALYQAEGRGAEAWAALQAAKLRDATPYLLIIRGELEASEGNYRSALRLFRRAKNLAPEIPEPLLAAARAQSARGRNEAALEAVRRALEIDPENEEGKRLMQLLTEADGPS